MPPNFETKRVRIIWFSNSKNIQDGGIAHGHIEIYHCKRLGKKIPYNFTFTPCNNTAYMLFYLYFDLDAHY